MFDVRKEPIHFWLSKSCSLSKFTFQNSGLERVPETKKQNFIDNQIRLKVHIKLELKFTMPNRPDPLGLQLNLNK